MLDLKSRDLTIILAMPLPCHVTLGKSFPLWIVSLFLPMWFRLPVTEFLET